MGSDLLTLTAQIVVAYVSNNQVEAEKLSSVLNDVYSTVSRLSGAPVATASKPLGNVAKQDETINDAYLVCLEDGAKVRVLKRYLRRFGLTPDEYRRKWDLPPDYPMTAPAYSRMRRRVAKKIGLGTRSVPKAPRH